MEEVIGQGIALQPISNVTAWKCIHMHFPMGFNLGLVSLDQAFVFNESICERPLFKAQIVYAPIMAIEEWFYVARNGLHMHQPRKGHCSKH